MAELVLVRTADVSRVNGLEKLQRSCLVGLGTTQDLAYWSPWHISVIKERSPGVGHEGDAKMYGRLCSPHFSRHRSVHARPAVGRRLLGCKLSAPLNPSHPYPQHTHHFHHHNHHHDPHHHHQHQPHPKKNLAHFLVSRSALVMNPRCGSCRLLRGVPFAFCELRSSDEWDPSPQSLAWEPVSAAQLHVSLLTAPATRRAAAEVFSFCGALRPQKP